MSAILQQLSVSDLLIEQRMKFEDLLIECNRLPPYNIWPQFEQEGDQKLVLACQEAENALFDLFNELVNVEKTLEQANPGLLQKSEDKDMDQEQEENEEQSDGMQSDQGFDEIDEENEDYLEYTDDEDEFEDEQHTENCYENEEDGDEKQYREICVDKNENKSNTIVGKEKSRSNLIKNEHNINEYLVNKREHLNSVRDKILDHWFQKTRYTLKGGKLDKNSLDSFEQSTVKSIQFALQNRFKLITRTQLKRSKYQIIGRPEEEQIDEPKSELVERKTKEVYDKQIYDDSDFYHQLLREMIGNLGPSTLNSSTKVNPKWLKLMKERFKNKKQVDTKATKARKIRYKVHDELVNFMTPMPYLCTYNENQINYLFASLFGNRPAQEDDDQDEDMDSDDD